MEHCSFSVATTTHDVFAVTLDAQSMSGARTIAGKYKLGQLFHIETGKIRVIVAKVPAHFFNYSVHEVHIWQVDEEDADVSLGISGVELQAFEGLAAYDLVLRIMEGNPEHAQRTSPSLLGVRAQ